MTCTVPTKEVPSYRRAVGARAEQRLNAERSRSGFALIDVLLALFLFSLGFAALYGLEEAALAETRAAVTLTEAANQAQTRMENLLSHSWIDNLSTGRIIPGGLVKSDEGFFQIQTASAWGELPWLLKVTVRVEWTQGKHRRSYELEGLYYVESSE